MANLIIDATKDKIFLTLMDGKDIYNVCHENSKINYEKMIILINEFLNKNKKTLNNIKKIYVNRGPGSYAGIRNSLSIIKGIFLTKKIDYYCFSFTDFDNHNNVKYADIPKLCDKFNIKKNLINPIYLS